MEQAKIESKLLHFIDNVVLDGQGEGLTPSTQLFALGILDSFALFRVIGFISEEFNIEVKMETLKSEEFESVASMASFVGSRLEAAGVDAALGEDEAPARKLA